jgi:hypothetical protein
MRQMTPRPRAVIEDTTGWSPAFDVRDATWRTDKIKQKIAQGLQVTARGKLMRR